MMLASPPPPHLPRIEEDKVLSVDVVTLDGARVSGAARKSASFMAPTNYYQPVQLPPSPTPSPSSSPYLEQSVPLPGPYSPSIHVTKPSRSSRYEPLLVQQSGSQRSQLKPSSSSFHHNPSLRVSTRIGSHGSPPHEWLKSGAAWIALYFAFNMGLTLYNKKILVHFPYPYCLTAIHTFCGTLGCLYLRHIGYFTPARLTTRQNIILVFFSVLYTLNIAVSNISLQLVTVPFHQVVRASAPLFTITVAYILGASRGKGLLGVGGSKLMSLAPVIAGVGFATYGDYSFTAWGFILTLFGTFLAALKTVLTSILQSASASSKLATPLPTATPKTASGGTFSRQQSTYLGEKNSPLLDSRGLPPSRSPSPLGFAFLTKRFDLDFDLQSQNVVDTSIKLHPLDLLLRMSPLAFGQCLLYGYTSGEFGRLSAAGTAGTSRWNLSVLALNGLIAFLLNVVSLTANQKNGPLTMTVAANVKQVLTILLAMYMFGLSVTWANAIGIALTLAGGAWYGSLEYKSKMNRIRTM